MRVVHARCCGLDVHKRTVVACVLLTADDGSVQRFVRTFGTMTGELLALSDWLERLGVGHLALESTAVYWRPDFNLLEGERHGRQGRPDHPVPGDAPQFPGPGEGAGSPPGVKGPGRQRRPAKSPRARARPQRGGSGRAPASSPSTWA
jgi:hypothetical protein